MAGGQLVLLCLQSYASFLAVEADMPVFLQHACEPVHMAINTVEGFLYLGSCTRAAGTADKGYMLCALSFWYLAGEFGTRPLPGFKRMIWSNTV